MTGTAAVPGPHGGRPRPGTPPPPSATATRFALLAVTVVAASTMLHAGTLFMVEEALGRSRQAQQTACADTLRSTAAGATETSDAAVLTRDFEGCVHGIAASVVLKTAALVLLTCAVAVVLYLGHARRARTGPAVGLDRLAADPRRTEAVDAVRQVLAEEAAPASVTVVFAPLQPGRTGRCVGFPGRYRIVLSLALAVHHAHHPHLLPGVLRHELAHVRNRDIGITQLTIALWWAFLATVALPALLASLLLGPLDIRYAVAETAVALLLLWFERAAVLRARELLADAAVQHPDYPQVLRTAAALPTATGTATVEGTLRKGVTGTARTRALSRLRRWFSYHPDWALREHRVTHPTSLLVPSLFEAGAAGILVGFGYQPLSSVVDSLWAPGPRLQPWLIGTCYAVLLSGVLGLAVWRAVWRSVVQHAPAVGLAWGAALLTMVWGCTAWQALTAEWWLASEVRPRPGAVIATLLVGPPLLGYLLRRWFFDLSGLLFAQTSGSYLAAGLLSRIIDNLTVGALGAAVAFAAAPWLLRGLRRGAGWRVAHRPDVPVPGPRWWVVGLCALAVIPVFLLLGSPLHADLLSGLQRADAQARSGADPATLQSGYAAFLPTALVGAGCIALSGLVVALTGRGTPAPGRRMRGSFPLLLLGAAAAAPGAAPLVLFHVQLAICGWSDIEACFSARLPLREAVVFGRWMLLCGVYAALAIMVILVAVPSVRSLLSVRSLPRRQTAPQPAPRARSRTRSTAARCIRGFLAGCGAVLTAATFAAVSVGLTPAQVDAARQPAVRSALEPYLVLRPGAVPWDRACAAGVRRNLQVDLNVATDQGLQFWWAGTVTLLGSSDDPGLVALAVAGRESLLGDDDLSTAQVLADAEAYCGYRFQARGTARGKALHPPHRSMPAPPART
ncbi:M48 family metalloprotease [Streptomyces chrestomyceticus]|uniref:M48 family metalloprotease n=1 Tax=Streptomyces chrestomyceticus TaxID=68185 RepID=UPI0019D2DCA3|nr:M48 family metalloprotease [Streptomyces chrestomyceticus]